VVEYRRFQEAWRKASHSRMALQIWSGGFGKPGSWAPGLGHFWRSGPDLGNRWDYDHKQMGPGAVMLNYDLQQAIPNIAGLTGPGSFAFLDNLVVGLPPNVPHAGDPGLTLVEARSHFSIWVMMASPLLLNHDIFHESQEVRKRLVCTII
jgi:alpha-galactosidase